jgi:tRNA(fMet)-specific endonuclease VapC
LRKKGMTVGHNDMMIAGTAIVNNMTLVTNNTKHYEKIDDLEIDNWSI